MKLYTRKGDSGQTRLGSGQQRERIKFFVVEAKNKDKNYLYSNQIYYIDPESWWIVYAEKFDKKGRLWKIFDTMMCLMESEYNGVMLPYPAGNFIFDVQRVHSTMVKADIFIGQTGELYQPEYFQPRALQKYGY